MLTPHTESLLKYDSSPHFVDEAVCCNSKIVDIGLALLCSWKLHMRTNSIGPHLPHGPSSFQSTALPLPRSMHVFTRDLTVNPCFCSKACASIERFMLLAQTIAYRWRLGIIWGVTQHLCAPELNDLIMQSHSHSVVGRGGSGAAVLTIVQPPRGERKQK